MSDDVLLQATHGAVTVLSLNRPASKNALNRALIEALGAALERAAGDATIRAVVLTGTGGSFCSGADIKSGLVEDPDLMSHLDQRIETFHRCIRAIVHADKPFVAAVDGPSVGFGCDLALACDLRIVTPRAYLQEKFVKIGLMPDGGGTFFLPRLVGMARAFELIYGGRAVEGEEAVRLGIANRVTSPDALQSDALAWAEELAKGPPLAFARIKRALWASAGGTIDDALAREKEGQLTCLRSQDAMEGILAWAQKREPRFSGT